MTASNSGFPLFVHAWFRSGSTYIWSKLRENEKLICFYEPFHEVLAEQSLGAQIEKHKAYEASSVMRHPVQDRHYFHEYKELVEQHQLNFAPDLSYKNYFLSPDQNDDPRYRHLQTLISYGAAVNRLPVLCFCRSQMRSAWIRKNFAGKHIAQIRAPLPQWESFDVLPYFRNTMITVALDLRENCPAYFDHIPNFNRFAAAFERRKSLPADQLYEYFLKPDDFLAIFLLVWVLSTLQSVSHSDLALDIDRLSSDRSYRGFVQEWFAGLGCTVDLSDCSIPKKVSADRQKASDMLVVAGRAVKQSPGAMLVWEPTKIASAFKFMSDESKRAIELFLNQ
jgi:hypothetical protein